MEIERKFLVDVKALHEWNRRNGKLRKIISMTQGYLSSSEAATVRVRIEDTKGVLTVKSKTTGISREEYEYEIPIEEAHSMLALCPSLISKTRWYYDVDGLTWEVDFFKEDNKGLVVAEVELESEDQEITLPEWVTEEVSLDHRYSNSNLIDNPYKEWK